MREEANDLLSATVELRRTLHEWPEVGNELPVTRDHVLEAIEGLPLDVTPHETTSGIAALLTGTKPGSDASSCAATWTPCRCTRTPGSTSPRTSTGRCTRAGTTRTRPCSSSAARLLAGRRDELAGRVLFMFQPGEEGHHGARFMLDEGLLDVPPLADGTTSPVTAAFAIHITSSLPSGWMSSRGGSIMASADTMTITVTGKGGHASEPHRAVDPIPVACEVVQALQLMVTRTVDVFDPSVVTVGQITAGTTNNVIPETATIVGTIRAVSEKTRSKVHDGIRRVVDGVAAAHGCDAVVDIDPGYPVTINDREFADVVLDVAGRVVGEDKVVRQPHPVMGAEDWSYVLQRVPGAMMFLGGTHADRNPATAAPNHSNRVLFDEQAMVNGIATYAAVALDHLT